METNRFYIIRIWKPIGFTSYGYGSQPVSHHTDMEGIKMSEIGVSINSTAAAYTSAYSSTTKADSKTEEKKEQDTASSTGAVYEKNSSDKPAKAIR